MILILDKETGQVLLEVPTDTLTGAHLENQNLRKAALAGADLTGASLQGADLRGADLQGANLEAANLEAAILVGADLFLAHLEGVNLQEAHLELANLDQAYLEGASLAQADLSYARLMGARLARADLTEANLKEASLARADLRNATLTDAQLQGATLETADLTGANLSGARLEGANLSSATLLEANLSGARLSGATLLGVNLTDAKLEEANLEEAILRGATLLGAALVRASFYNASLQDADLTGATGLVADRLGGANLRGAGLPTAIGPFDALANVAEASKNAGRLLTTLLTGCLYAWLTLPTTTDTALLTDAATPKLPLLDTPLSLVWFYRVAPAVLFGLYCYVHVYLLRSWEMLIGLPARFPDGTPLDQKAYPWLMNGLVRAHMPLLEERPPLFWVQYWLSVLVGWFVVPPTLFFFWEHYLRWQDRVSSLEQALLLAGSCGAALYYLRLARATLDRQAADPDRRRSIHGWSRGVGGVSVLLFGGLSLWALNGPPLRIMAWRSYMDLRDADVSTKPQGWTGEDEVASLRGALPAAKLALVQPARLPGRRLRHALAQRVFLVRADLRGADLTGARLSQARLQGAQLQNARLTGADLRGARLQGADLRGATLLEAELTGADLAEVRADSHTRWPDGFSPPRPAAPGRKSR
jgi:uncharacterized protein YjbI with pentapeptide repeats